MQDNSSSDITTPSLPSRTRTYVPPYHSRISNIGYIAPCPIARSRSSPPTQPIPSHPKSASCACPARGTSKSVSRSTKLLNETSNRRDRCSAVWLGICLLKAGTRRHSACEWPAWICPGSERTSLHLLAAFGGAVSRRVGFRIRGRWGLKAGTGAMPQRAKMTTAVDRLSAGDGGPRTG
jgi:hypothetical protein